MKEDDDLRAKTASLSRKLETLEMKVVNEVSVMQPTEQTYRICALVTHSTEECPTIPTFQEVMLEKSYAISSFQKQYNNTYSETYNQGWRQHPDFS